MKASLGLVLVSICIVAAAFILDARLLLRHALHGWEYLRCYLDVLVALLLIIAGLFVAVKD